VLGSRSRFSAHSVLPPRSPTPLCARCRQAGPFRQPLPPRALPLRQTLAASRLPCTSARWPMASASLPPRASVVLARWSRWVWAAWTGWPSSPRRLGAELNDRVKLRQSRGHHDHLPCCGRTDPPIPPEPA
jgi:hypothetical protein